MLWPVRIIGVPFLHSDHTHLVSVVLLLSFSMAFLKSAQSRRRGVR